MEDKVRMSGPLNRVFDVLAARERAQLLVHMRTELEACWQEAVKTQAGYADRKTKPQCYAVRDIVMLSGKNIQTNRSSKKLDNKFYGLFKVLAVIETQAYLLNLSDLMQLYPIFHVSLLEPYGGSNYPDKRLEPILVDSKEQYVVKAILDSRHYYRKIQYLVKWQRYPDNDNTWCLLSELTHVEAQIQEFHWRYPNKPKKPLALGHRCRGVGRATS